MFWEGVSLLETSLFNIKITSLIVYIFINDYDVIAWEIWGFFSNVA
jgi:hypothetical protein